MMVKRKTLKEDPCPVARGLDVVGDHWSLLIVRDAFDGVRRFSAFQKNLGVARNILSDRLHKLVDHGVLAVSPASDGTAYGEYVLTAKGLALFPLLVSLRQWSEQFLFREGEAHSTLVLQDTGEPVPPLRLLDQQGRALAAADTVVRKLKEDGMKEALA
jgi:DNA-binding HxlR family transcriptional regulator